MRCSGPATLPTAFLYLYSVLTAAVHCMLPPPCTFYCALKTNINSLLLSLTMLRILQHDELDEEVSEVMSKVAAAERRGISGIAQVLLH